MAAWLGPGAFETISGEVVNVTLLLLTQHPPCKNQKIHGIDASIPHTAAEKAAQLITATMKSVEQAKQLENPDAVVALENIQNHKMLSDYAIGLAGVLNGDTARFEVCFWEVSKIGNV